MSNLTTRAGKGSPLTNNELDANFTNLNADKVEIGGDLSGTSTAPNVAKIQGRAVSADTPENGEKLVWNGTAWEPSVDPTGEPIGHANKADSTISFDSGTRTFTIAPVAASFTVWCKGVKHTYTSAQTVVIPDTTGLHFIYFNASGVLSTQMSYFTWEEHAPTAYIYWNATTQQAVYFGDERHGITLDWQTHEYLHRTRGAAIASGFGASGYTTTGAGSTDADAQIDIGGGTFFDEDLQVDIVSTNTPVAGTWQQDLSGPARIPVLYLSGSAWVIDAPTDFPFKVVSGVPQYNLYSGGTWSASPVANNGYFVSWILATHNLTYPVVAVISQAATNQVSEAEAMTFEGLTLSGFPSVEFRPLYKVIYQHKTSFANNIKASTIAVYDLRSISAAGVAAALVQDHGNLSGLGDDDHAQYLHVSAVRSPSAAVTNSFLPSQASQSGKYLTTDGSNPSWGTIPSGSLTFTGDVTGSGNTGSSTTLTLANSGVTAGTFTKVTVDAKGRVTNGASASNSDITTALGFTPENVANKAVANGYASLDSSGKVPSNQLPSYVDDVLEYANLAAFPGTGETGKIYIAIDTAKTYRWSGSAYVEITASPGSTDAVPEGSTNLYFTNARARAAVSASGSLSYSAATGIFSYTQPINVSAFTNDSGYLTGITSAQVTTALGYTPYNATNPNGYITGITSGMVTTALGYTPYNSSNPSGYITSSSNITGTAAGITGYTLADVTGTPTTVMTRNSGGDSAVGSRFHFTTCTADGGNFALVGLNWGGAAGTYKDFEVYDYPNSRPLFRAFGSTRNFEVPGKLTTTGIDLAGQTDSIGYNATTNLGTYIKGTGNTYLYGGGEFYDGTASRQILTSGNYSSFTVARAGGSFVGRVVFPSGVFDRPQFPGGILGLDTGDGNFDIWGISRDYYPSHATASSAWGIRWDGDSNQVRFIGAGTTRLAVDLDGGSSGLTWEGNVVLNASNYSSGYFKTVNGSSIIGTGDLTVSGTDNTKLPLSGGTLTGTIYVGTSGSTSATRALRVGPSGGSPASFGSYTGSWRSTIEIWDNAATRMLHLTPPDGTNYNYSSIKSTDAGLRIDVGGSGGTNAIDIGTNGVANFPQGLQQGGNQVLHAGNYSDYALPKTGGTMTGSRPIQISPSDGALFITAGSGGWSMGTYFKGSSGTIRAGFGALGSNNDLSYAWIGTGYDGAWMTLTPSAVNSTVALQQGGNQVLHAGNYSSYTNFGLGITVNNASADGRGINLYSGSPTSPDYGLFFAQTQNFGTYGAVSADWATYFTMNSTAHRGWIFREHNSLGNVAAISNQGNMTIRSHFEQGNNIARPNVSWSAASGSTGMVIFYLPGTTGNYGMVHMVFDIYEYNSNAVSTVIVGGHNWSTSWYNISANVIGQCGKEVRLGVKNGRFCVVFGTSGSSWEYGTIVLRKIHNGSFYDNVMNMVGDWESTQTATESFTSITGDLRALRTPASFNAGGSITQAGNQVLHAGNYGGYALPLSGGTMTGHIALSDNRLYLRTNGDTNHYLWNAADDWEELVAYSGTGFRIISSTNSIIATFSTGNTFFWSPISTTDVINVGYNTAGSVATSARRGIDFHGADTNYWIGKRSGTWTQPLDVSFYTGIRYHAHSAYGGHKFYATGYDSTEALSVGNGDSNVRVINTLYSYAYRGNGNVAGTGEATYHPAGIYSTSTNWLYGTMYRNGSDTYSEGGSIYSTNQIVCSQNYGRGLNGVYDSYRFQHVWMMGTSYQLAADGTTTGNAYGIAWSHPNAGGVAGNLDSHGMLILINGGFASSMSYSIRASGNVTAYSDERLKTNWREMPENYVERLAQVKVGIYDRIDGEKITQVGIGAQSFQRLLPEAITKATDEMGTLSVSYGNAAMASAVELAKELVMLKKELAEIKSRLH